MIDTAAMLLFPFGTTPEIRERLATRHRWVWIKTSADVLASVPALMGPCDFGTPLGLAAELKCINPSVRVGMYVGGIASPDSHHPHYDWLDDGDLLHASPSQPLVWSPTTVPHQPGERRLRVINYSSPKTRAKMIGCWRAFLAEHSLDGVVFDTFNPGYYAAWMAQAPASPNAYGGFGLTSGGVEGPFHTEAWWFTALSTFCSQLRWALAQDGREVWVNGLYEYPNYVPTTDQERIGRGYSSVSNYVSGQLSEFGHVMYDSVPALRGNLTVAALANVSNRGAFWLFQPVFQELPDTQDTHRFYLACYLLLQHVPYTLFGYHPKPDPYQAFEVVEGEHRPYLFDGGEDWDHDYGVALSGVLWAGSVAYRKYTRGWAVVNASDGYGYLTLPAGTYRIWHPIEGGAVEITPVPGGMNVPPKWGAFLWSIDHA